MKQWSAEKRDTKRKKQKNDKKEKNENNDKEMECMDEKIYKKEEG